MTLAMSQWVVYDHPLDHPDGFIARRWEINGIDIRATADTLAGTDLEQIRRVLRDELGLYCLTRYAEDDPSIVEVWL